ncbi:MAG: L-seryl-tRNA(Sec) selenium transferase [Proteobacteria bacterium]|nr:L-seryl-tRNA(Sec) selenium transferase [Pseudomonadota bacterium]
MKNIKQTPDNDSYRQLPGVDNLLRQSPELIKRWGHEQVSAAVRGELDRLRQALQKGEVVDTKTDAIKALLQDKLVKANEPSLRPVLNLTGTVLHTNLGRACLPPEAVEAVVAAASFPSNLEFDLASGKRGDRESHIEALVCELTGAEAATAVNNNAAAVLLVLNTLALSREVPVSRGELVEIGGSFRIPEVMQRSGCTLVEVGATNRTHLKDYRAAINSNTALLMKVHTSNYRIEGFTTAVAEAELAALAHEHKLPLVIDLGSGNLVDFSALGLPHEPTVADAIESGADLVTFSGDKLLGGPQAGIIAGRRELIEQIKKNPLKRALRLDKMTLAALEAVLRLYRNPDALVQNIPGLRLLTRSVEALSEQAVRLLGPLQNALPQAYTVKLAEGFSQIGSGAMPEETISTVCLHIKPTIENDASLRRLAQAFRELPLPVLGRVNNGVLIFDLRCLENDKALLNQLPQLGVALS